MGGIPSGLTQNVKDLLASREIENIFENSDFIYMLNQAQGDSRFGETAWDQPDAAFLCGPTAAPARAFCFFGNVIIPFVDHFPKDTSLYQIMTTRPEESRGGRDVITFFTAWRIGGDAVAKG